MPDSHTPEQRRYNMSRIRSSGTTPETRLRTLLHAMFPDAVIEEHPATLPGKPDFYLPELRLAVFADGCFFHRCPRHFVLPLNNREYWTAKIARNRQRDCEIHCALKALGIYPLRIWEHNLGRDLTLARRQIRRACRAAMPSAAPSPEK
jgi:DNA mismatch endonuclease, patch repair protein